MSKNRNRAYLNKAQTGREYHIKVLNKLYPSYWDDGINFHPKYRRGYKESNKRIMAYQVRMYRTWKYNRKKQWK